jgi:hypothetical protein
MKQKGKETKCSSQLGIKETDRQKKDAHRQLNIKIKTERQTENRYTQRMKQKDKQTK